MDQRLIHNGADIIAMSRRHTPQSEPMILMVGDPNRLQSTKPYYPKSSGVFFIEFADLTKEVFLAINPSVVMSPAICARFDCLELADFLESVRYCGAYRVIPDSLPYPEIVKREICFNNPSLDVEFVEQNPAMADQMN